MDKKTKLNLDDLRVESFETLPEMTAEESQMAVGGAVAGTGCYYLCSSGCDTVVCCYPTLGNGSGK